MDLIDKVAVLSQHSAVVNAPAPRPVTADDIDFRHLNTFVDVVYGAVLGYILYQLSSHFRPLFENGIIEEPAATLFLELFVLNYLIGDFVEARLFNGAFPYTRHVRFVLDLTIAFGFLVTFIAAESASVLLFVPLAAVFFCGAAWAFFLHLETKRRISWQYPWLTVGVHVAAGCLCLAFFLYRQWTNQYRLFDWGVGLVWLTYAVWTVSVTALKEFFDVPECEAQLFPMSLLDVTVRAVIRGLRPEPGKAETC